MNSNKINRYTYNLIDDMNYKDTQSYQNSCIVDLFINNFPSESSIILYEHLKDFIRENYTGDDILEMIKRLNKYIYIDKLINYNENSLLLERLDLLIDTAKKIYQFITENLETLIINDSEDNSDKNLQLIENFLNNIMNNITYGDIEKLKDNWSSIIFN